MQLPAPPFDPPPGNFSIPSFFLFKYPSSLLVLLSRERSILIWVDEAIVQCTSSTVIIWCNTSMIADFSIELNINWHG